LATDEAWSGSCSGTVRAIDTINYIPERDGRIPVLYDGPLSSSEVLAATPGTAHVVKHRKH
jgi:hypothetical protein